MVKEMTFDVRDRTSSHSGNFLLYHESLCSCGGDLFATARHFKRSIFVTVYYRAHLLFHRNNIKKTNEDCLKCSQFPLRLRCTTEIQEARLAETEVLPSSVESRQQ